MDTNTSHITPETVNAELENLTVEAEGSPEQIAVREGEQKQLVQSQDEWKEIVQHLAGPAFATLAPGWNIQEVEIEALADAYAGLLNKYFPGGASQMGPELGAAMVTVAIFAPRLKMPRHLPVVPEEDKGPKDGS